MSAKALKNGDLAPNFELMDEDAHKVRLSDYRGKRVVVYFYPKDDTAGCTTQACRFRDEYSEIEAVNATVLGISPDNEESHRRFRSKNNLPFHLLVDEQHKTAEAYGVWGGLANIRSHFVVDENGRLEDIQIRVSPEDSVERAMRSLEVKQAEKT